MTLFKFGSDRVEITWEPDNLKLLLVSISVLLPVYTTKSTKYPVWTSYIINNYTQKPCCLIGICCLITVSDFSQCQWFFNNSQVFEWIKIYLNFLCKCSVTDLIVYSHMLGVPIRSLKCKVLINIIHLFLVMFCLKVILFSTICL